MSNKLYELLEAIKEWNLSEAINKAYNAYMEERNTILQVGQEIEVRKSEKGEWIIKKFISFTKDGLIIADDDEAELPDYWKYYRIPTRKKKYKVLKGEIFPFVVAESDTTDLPIITTFED